MLDADVREAKVELTEKLVHARAHELLHETTTALSRRLGISPEDYFRAIGKDEETLAHEAEPEADRALRRDAVLAAVVEAEGIEPSDEDLFKALEPVAQRDATTPEKVMERLRKGGQLDRLREDLAARQALELLVREAKAITVEQAKARQKLWTPGREAGEGGSGQLWTPGQ